MSFIECNMGIKRIAHENIDEYLKDIFAKKENMEYIKSSGSDTIHRFSYNDIIKERKVIIEVQIHISSDLSELEKIKLICNSEEIDENELKNYYYMVLYPDISLNILKQEQTKYTVRVYYYIIHDTGIKGEYVVNLKNKIRFKELFNDKVKNIYAERIIAIDCEVEAVSLTHARTKALSISKDFVAQLSVLIDTGFYLYDSYFAHFMNRIDNEWIRCFWRKSFFDPELNIFVMNNIDRLRHYKDYKAIEEPSFWGYSFIDMSTGITTDKHIMTRYESLNENLEREFKNLKIGKSKDTYYREDIDISGIYQYELLIPKQIRKYFKGIENLTGYKSTYFRNCCRLYNIAQTCGMYEPTLMISYMVSATECLAKAEELSFTEFMKKYLKDEYEKKFCDELYGDMRSGHFHSGDMFFNEYNINLDPALDVTFFDKQEKLIKARRILRLAIISWINTYIIAEVN